MYPVLFSLYEGISIHTYGFCILGGVIIALFIASVDQWPAVQHLWPLWESVILFLAGGILFASRLLYCIAQNDLSLKSLFSAQGGFSILGGLLGACGALYIVSLLYKKPYLSLLDILAIYAPCVQSFARIGCFFAGCCAGAPTNLWTGIWYPCLSKWCYSHPLQLYSALFYILLFMILYYYRKRLYCTKGSLGGIYLLASALERYLQDYLRAQPTFNSEITIDTAALFCVMLLGIYLLISSGRIDE